MAQAGKAEGLNGDGGGLGCWDVIGNAPDGAGISQEGKWGAGSGPVGNRGHLREAVRRIGSHWQSGRTWVGGHPWSW